MQKPLIICVYLYCSVLQNLHQVVSVLFRIHNQCPYFRSCNISIFVTLAHFTLSSNYLVFLPRKKKLELGGNKFHRFSTLCYWFKKFPLFTIMHSTPFYLDLEVAPTKMPSSSSTETIFSETLFWWAMV